MLSAGLMMLALFWLLGAKTCGCCWYSGLPWFLATGGMATMEFRMVANVFGMRSHGVILGLVFFCDTVGGAMTIFSRYVSILTYNYNLSFLTLRYWLSVINLVAILVA